MGQKWVLHNSVAYQTATSSFIITTSNQAPHNAHTSMPSLAHYPPLFQLSATHNSYTHVTPTCQSWLMFLDCWTLNEGTVVLWTVLYTLGDTVSHPRRHESSNHFLVCSLLILDDSISCTVYRQFKCGESLASTLVVANTCMLNMFFVQRMVLLLGTYLHLLYSNDIYIYMYIYPSVSLLFGGQKLWFFGAWKSEWFDCYSFDDTLPELCA
jgi:hypothetical protein